MGSERRALHPRESASGVGAPERTNEIDSERRALHPRESASGGAAPERTNEIDSERRALHPRESASGVGAPEPAISRATAHDATRNATLVRRLRVLLHTFPIHALRQADLRREESLRHYSSPTIALKMLDLIAEHMGMDEEVDRDTLVSLLAPTLSAMDRAAGLPPDTRRHEAIVDRVLGGLRNDLDARRPFVVNYADLDDEGGVTPRQLEFRLVQDAFSPSGQTVLRLTHEAVNLYFNALELDIEDAQAATEAIVHSQLARGRFDEASRSASFALRQSRMYRERLARILRDTRRDIARVDWQREVPALIDDAMKHIEVRVDSERAILASTHERLDHLPAGSREAAAVAQIADVMQQCIDTHGTLQRELMGARSVFLDSQARQAFLPLVLRQRPDLLNEVMQPMLAMPQKHADTVLKNTVPQLFGPQSLPVLSLHHLVEGLLRPRRAQRRIWVEVEPVDTRHGQRELARYSPETRAAAEAFLRQLGPRTRLGLALALARAHGLGLDELEVIVLYALQHFDVEATDKPLLFVEGAGDERLDDPDFYGDELLLTPIDPLVSQPSSPPLAEA